MDEWEPWQLRALIQQDNSDNPTTRTMSRGKFLMIDIRDESEWCAFKVIDIRSKYECRWKWSTFGTNLNVEENDRYSERIWMWIWCKYMRISSLPLDSAIRVWFRGVAACTWHCHSLAAWNSVRVPVSTWFGPLLIWCLAHNQPLLDPLEMVLSPQPTD